MKHCDCGIGDVRGRLSPLARPFTFGSSSSSFVQPGSSCVFSAAASESEPEDSIWGDYAFDLSFLTSDDQRSGLIDDDSLSNLSRDPDATTALLKEGSELFGQAPYTSVKDRKITPRIMRQDNEESFLGRSIFFESDLRSVDSQPKVSPSVPVISTNQSNSVVNLEEGGATHFSSTSIIGHTDTSPSVNGVSVANMSSGDSGAEGQLPYTKGKAACCGKVLVDQSIEENNPVSFFSNTSELQIRCSIGADNDKLDLRSADATSKSEKSSIPSDQDDSEVDSPCWRGTQCYNTVVSGSKSMSLRLSSDDLTRFNGLNPLAPHFIPTKAKKSVDKHAKECEQNNVSSLKKSLSSTFPFSSGDYNLTDIPNKAGIQKSNGRIDRATGASFLVHNADKKFGFVSQDCVSNTVSELDSRNELQTSKKLDPSAPLFVPASAKLNGAIHEKQAKLDRVVALEINAHSASLSSLKNRLLNNVEAEMCSAEFDGSFGNQYYDGAHNGGTSGSFNPWIGPQVEISENASFKSPNNKLHERGKLNPRAPQFFVVDTNQTVDGCENNPAKDDTLPVMNNGISSTASVCRDHNVMSTALVRSKSSVVEPYSGGTGVTQMEYAHPSKLLRNSLKSYVADQPTMLENHFVPVKQLVVKPKTRAMKGDKNVDHFPSFHIREDSTAPSSSNMRALSDLSPRFGCPSSLSSPKMDRKKILTTMLELSELLTTLQGNSCDSDSPNEQEIILINCIIQNLDMYTRTREGHTGNSSNIRRGSYDPKQFANMHKVSARDLQTPGANNMTVNLDLKRKEKYSAASSEIVPHPHLSEIGVTKGNVSSQGVANSTFQQNYPTEEQINPQVLFYRSLWLKAEADRCLTEYEASLSRIKL